MKYPSAIKFAENKDGIKVGYKKDSKYNLDIWAISYILNKNIFKNNSIKTIQLDSIDGTMILRIYFLQKLFRGFKFLPDVNVKAEDILEKIKKKKYITYPHDYKFPKRGTKNEQESMPEAGIFKNLSKCFNDEFKKDEHGLRQFPANIFEGKVEKTKRISRKFWIDILTVNKNNQLSVIELKVGNNAPLDLFIQAIDYGVFAYLFREHISKYPFINNKRITNRKVAIYIVAEKFHPAIIGKKGVAREIRKNPLFDIHLIQIKRKGCSMKSSKEILCI